MAIKPEFISLLRDIRDRIYPGINAAYDYIHEKYLLIVDIMADIKAVSVIDPITVVPVKENGDPGDPFVTFNNDTAEFTFGIPAGSKGQDLAIESTYATLAEMYSATPFPETGTVVFVEEDSKVYVKLNTGTNGSSADWSSGTQMTPTTKFQDLSDTPTNMVGNALYNLRINAQEDALEYYEVIPGTGDPDTQYNVGDGTEPQHAVNKGQLDALGVVEPTPNTVSKRDGLGNLKAVSFVPSLKTESVLPNFIMTSVNLTDDMTMRPTSLQTLSDALTIPLTNSGWRSLTMKNGFTGYAQYREWSDRTIEVRLSARNTSASSSWTKKAIATLPSNARPEKDLFTGIHETTRLGTPSVIIAESSGDIVTRTVGDYTHYAYFNFRQ